MEGNKGDPEYGGCHVFRADPDGSLTIVADDFVKPDGLAFSPYESALCIADTGRSHDPEGPAHIRRFDAGLDNALSGGEVFCECSAGLFDGFRFDTDGRIWSSAADGIHCIDQDGRLIGKILAPEVVSNLTFGGPKRNRLYITATSSIYSVFVMATGAQKP